MVTVQFSCKSKLAIGLPTILDLPTITAFLPVRSPSLSFNNNRQPNGVHGIIDFWPVLRRPTFDI